MTPFVATQRQHAHVPTMTFGHLTHTLSANTLWDVRVGRFVYCVRTIRARVDWTMPNRFDRSTRVNSDAPPQVGGLALIRTTAKATLTHYQRELLRAVTSGDRHGDRKGRAPSACNHSGGIRYVDDNGQPFRPFLALRRSAGGQFIRRPLFATDAMTIGERLTVNAGLRFDHSRAISQDLKAVDCKGVKPATIIRGLGTLYTWNVLSPRLGVTAKLSADGRTILASKLWAVPPGRVDGEIGPNHPGLAPITTMAFDPATGGYTTSRLRRRSQLNLWIDPETRSPRTDRVLDWRGSRAALDGCRRDCLYPQDRQRLSSHGPIWEANTEKSRERCRTAKRAGSVLVNSTAARRFLVTNPDGYFVKYNGLVIAAEKRRSAGGRCSAPIRIQGSMDCSPIQRSNRRWSATQHHCECLPMSRSVRIQTT